MAVGPERKISLASESTRFPGTIDLPHGMSIIVNHSMGSFARRLVWAASAHMMLILILPDISESWIIFTGESAYAGHKIYRTKLIAATTLHGSLPVS